MPDRDQPRDWAPLEPGPDAPTAAVPPTAPSGGGVADPWGPPRTPPGWGPPASAHGWGPPPPEGAFGTAPPLPKAGDARTGPLPMHPMSVGDVLDGAFKLLKANARTIVLVVAAVIVPVQLLSAFVVREQVSIGFMAMLQDPTLANSDSSDFGMAASSVVSLLLSLLTGPFIAGAVSRVVAASYLGTPIGPAAALKHTSRRFGALLVASVLVFLVQAVGLVLCIVPGVLAFALYTAVTPAVMVEELGPVEAMRRSWRLLRPRMWAVLGIAVLARLIAGMLGNLVGGLPSVTAVFLGGSFAWLFIAVGGIVSSLVSAPVVAIVATLLYFDARIRHEGFDLQIMAADLERSAVG